MRFRFFATIHNAAIRSASSLVELSALAVDSQQLVPATWGFKIWPVGVDPVLDDPSKQWIAHHFCEKIQDVLIQCALYESNKSGAKLTGIEYVVADDRFKGQNLPKEEKQHWHPNNLKV